MELLHNIFHYRNVLHETDHKRLLDLCDTYDWPDPTPPDADTLYDIKGFRSHVLLSEDEEIYGLIHKAMLRTMPKIYKDYSDRLPTDLYDKYSGYWLCKYPEGGYLSIHSDSDADAASVTASFNINSDYDGGEICFWNDHCLDRHENSIHVYPSNHLFMHEVKPVTKGSRYSVITWFSYQKGRQW